MHGHWECKEIACAISSSFLKLRAELGKDTTDKVFLQFVVFPVIATNGPEGLWSLLLALGVIPRLARKAPYLTQLECSHGVWEATTAAQEEQCKRRITSGLKHKGRGKWLHASTQLRHLPAARKGAVWRMKKKIWDRLDVSMSIDGKMAVIQLRHVRRISSLYYVKSYNQTLWHHANTPPAR